MVKIKVILILYLYSLFSFTGEAKINTSKDEVSFRINRLKDLQNENLDQYQIEFVELEKRFNNEKEKNHLLELYLIQTTFLESSNKLDSLVSTLHRIRYLQMDSGKDQLANTYLDLALAFDQKGDYDSLLFWSSRAEELIDTDSPYYGKLLVTQSFRSKFDGSYLESIEKLIQSVKIFESRGENQSLANAFTSIAYFYGRLGDLKNQEQALLNSLEINKSLSNKLGLVGVYNNLGVCLKSQNRLTEALTYYDLAFEILEELDSPMSIAQNLTNRGNIYEAQKDFEKAEELFLACETICQTHNIQYGIMLANLNLGNLYRQMKRFNQARVRLDIALSLSKKLKTKREEYLTFERLAWLERDRGDFGKAYQYLSDFQILRDSVVNESVQKEALELKEKYESEKKQNEIILLSKEKLRQQSLIVILTLGLLFLVFAILWIFNKNRLLRLEKQKEQQRLNYELELKGKELLTDSIRRVSIMNTKDAVSKELKELVADLPKTQAHRFKKIQRELASSKDDFLLQEFETRFLGVYESFFLRLKELAPDLTPTELRIAALIRLNFTSKEIASITNRSVGTIDNLRSNIRKKLSLTDDESLTQKLLDI